MGIFYLSPILLKPPTFSIPMQYNSTVLFLSKKKKKEKNMFLCRNTGSERISKVLSIEDREKAQMDVGGSIFLQNEIALKEVMSLLGSELLDSSKGRTCLSQALLGLFGRVLIEKVLRTIADMGKIFLVIKAKSKEAAMKRLQNEILQADLFKCLKEIHGESYQYAFMLSKLVPVVGDVRKDDLDIEVDLAEEIAREVDIVVNFAANTTFDKRYDVAHDTNTRGPSRLMRFAKAMQETEALSASYVNGQREGRVLERPFHMGESIERERPTTESSANSLPELDVEAELELIGASLKKI